MGVGGRVCLSLRKVLIFLIARKLLRVEISGSTTFIKDALVKTAISFRHGEEMPTGVGYG